MTPSAKVPFHRYWPPGQSAPRDPQTAEPYYPDAPLALAVNTALSVGWPLLLTGEPGCGKSALADSLAQELDLGEVLRFHTRSDHQARDALYSFDSLRRLHDVQAHAATPVDLAPQRYVRYAALGQAIIDGAAGKERVVLIDEIDKAPVDFPNDLLDVIDKARFTIAETGVEHVARARPLVIITSNVERQLPRPFLRRCVYHHLSFPEGERLARIVKSRFDAAAVALCDNAVLRFQELRRSGIQHAPGTAELIGWVRVLLHAEVPLKALSEELRLFELPSLGVLVKREADLDLIKNIRG